MILPSEDRMFPVLQELLSRSAKRQQALSSNIANLDTPGYRAKDYDFKSELHSLEVTRTSEKHISIKDTSSSRVIEVGTTEKPNGNTVDIERELTEITKNGLEYLTLVQYLNQKIRTLRNAITEGGKV
jgi:flagellar basal-body rod protein FlgB